MALISEKKFLFLFSVRVEKFSFLEINRSPRGNCFFWVVNTIKFVPPPEGSRPLSTLESEKKPSVRRFSALALIGALALAPVVVGGDGALADGGCTLAGAGTSGDPWQVSDEIDLRKVGVVDCTLIGFYLQDADITLTSAWTPVSTGFSGTYDGANYSITGLQVNGGDSDKQGMFREVSGTVTRVNLVGASVTTTQGSSGTLVGYLDVDGIVSYSRASGSVTGEGLLGGLVGVSRGLITDSSAGVTVSGSGTSAGGVGTGADVGGLLGKNDGGTVTNSHATGSVTSTSDYVGGLVGRSLPDSVLAGGVISASSSTGAVTGDDSVGGLVGLLESAKIEESYSSSVVVATGTAGGLVGWMKDEWGAPDAPFTSATVEYSYASGSVTSTGDYVGGLVGLSRRSDVYDSYASGAVVGDDKVGGLAGYFSGQIVHAYSVGSVRATADDPEGVGGFLGYDDGADLIANFWDVETSGFATSAGAAVTKLEGLSSQAMRSIAPYTADALVEATWGIVAASQFSAPLNNASPPPSPLVSPDGTPFEEIWGIGPSVNSGYPFLWWQTGTGVTVSAGTSPGSSSPSSTSPAIHLELKAKVSDRVAGAPVLMEGQGLKPGSSYSLVVRSTPVTVKSGVVSSGGSFSHTVNMPSGVAPGVHTITLSGVGAGGERLVLTQPFTVAANGTFSAIGPVTGKVSGGLAATGPSEALLLGGGSLAALLLVAGASLLIARRQALL